MGGRVRVVAAYPLPSPAPLPRPQTAFCGYPYKLRRDEVRGGREATERSDGAAAASWRPFPHRGHFGKPALWRAFGGR